MLSSATRAHNSGHRALRAPAAAQWLNERLNITPPVTARILWRLTRTRQIPTLIIGGKYFYCTDELEAWIQAGGGTPPGQSSGALTSDERRSA